MVNYRYVEKNTTNVSAEAMFHLLHNNKVLMSTDNHVILIKNDVTYEYGGISRGGGTNMVGLIALSIAFGVVLNIIKEDGLPLVNLFRSLWTASMKLVEIIMWYVGILNELEFFKFNECFRFALVKNVFMKSEKLSELKFEISTDEKKLKRYFNH